MEEGEGWRRVCWGGLRAMPNSGCRVVGRPAEERPHPVALWRARSPRKQSPALGDRGCSCTLLRRLVGLSAGFAAFVDEWNCSGVPDAIRNEQTRVDGQGGRPCFWAPMLRALPPWRWRATAGFPPAATSCLPTRRPPQICWNLPKLGSWQKQVLVLTANAPPAGISHWLATQTWTRERKERSVA